MSKNKVSILLVDDDIYCRLGIKTSIAEFGHISEASDSATAIKMVKSGHFDLAIIDMQMETEAAGLEVLKITKSKKIPSIILSSMDDDELTEKSYDLGCMHFLNKLHYKSHLEHYIRKFIENRNGTDRLQEILKTNYITQDHDTIEQLKMISGMNIKDKCIFLKGETGVGKSQIGKIIHLLGHGEKKPLIHINCSEISENIMESEFFGHVKGSFTGATNDKKGKLELAHGGTLFLDEIGTMPLVMQKKLLKAIEEKEFYPVGATKPVKSSFTLISATCEDLLDKILNNEFRKDFFFRISGINLEIRPLRQRKEDIVLLTKYFLQNLPRKMILKPDVMDYFKDHDWPGNIRELKKTLDYLATLNIGIITSEHLPEDTLNFTSPKSEFLNTTHLDFIQENGFRNLIERLEQEAVQQMMKKHSGKITKAIKELQISNSAFYRILGQESIGM